MTVKCLFHFYILYIIITSNGYTTSSFPLALSNIAYNDIYGSDIRHQSSLPNLPFLQVGRGLLFLSSPIGSRSTILLPIPQTPKHILPLHYPIVSWIGHSLRNERAFNLISQGGLPSVSIKGVISPSMLTGKGRPQPRIPRKFIYKDMWIYVVPWPGIQCTSLAWPIWSARLPSWEDGKCLPFWIARS